MLFKSLFDQDELGDDSLLASLGGLESPSVVLKQLAVRFERLALFLQQFVKAGQSNSGFRHVGFQHEKEGLGDYSMVAVSG